MSTMTPMDFTAYFFLGVNDENDPDSSLILYYVSRSGEEARELGNSFGATREDFKWVASCLATFHRKPLIDVDGESISGYPMPAGMPLQPQSEPAFTSAGTDDPITGEDPL